MAPPSLNLKPDVFANCVSQHSSQSTDQVSPGRNQLLPFLELLVIALTNQFDWWHHELDCVTLSYKRLLDYKLDIVHKLLNLTKVRHHLLSPFVKGYYRCKSQLQALTSSSLHVILAEVVTKRFLPVTSFVLILPKFYWPFFRL